MGTFVRYIGFVRVYSGTCTKSVNTCSHYATRPLYYRIRSSCPSTLRVGLSQRDTSLGGDNQYFVKMLLSILLNEVPVAYTPSRSHVVGVLDSIFQFPLRDLRDLITT